MNFDSLYGHVMAVLTPLGLVLGIVGVSAKDAFRKKRASRAETPAVEHEPVRTLPAAKPAPTPVPGIASAVLFAPNVNASGAATTIGTSFVTPIAPIKHTPGAIFSSLPAFSTVPAGTATA